MNEPIYRDAEYESIRTVMNSRGKHVNQLPVKTIRYIPETSRTDAVIALDARIAKLQKYAPFIISGTMILISFLAGTLV
jgi:hypothetical protein